MGRHARGATRSRVPVAVVVWTVVVLMVLAAGAWLGDRGLVADSANPVSASAVVVSSLACTDDTGTTLVDVVDPASPLSSPVRATLDACGYQEGQQLAVQFDTADPARVVLAGTAPAAGAGLLPLGVAIAALLALGAGLVVLIDSRRRPNRHRAPGTGRHLMDHENLDPTPDPVQGPASDRADGGRHLATADGGDRVAVLAVLAVAGRRQASVDLTFPFSSTLAASLHDELFTHRSVSS